MHVNAHSTDLIIRPKVKFQKQISMDLILHFPCCGKKVHGSRKRLRSIVKPRIVVRKTNVILESFVEKKKTKCIEFL